MYSLKIQGYEIQINDDLTEFRCLKNGDIHKNLLGDDLTLALVNKVQELQDELDYIYSCHSTENE